MLLSIIVFGYVIPAALTWKYIHCAHTERGIYAGLPVTFVDIFAVFLPLCNLYCCFLWLSDYPIRRNSRKSNIAKKFFNIK